MRFEPGSKVSQKISRFPGENWWKRFHFGSQIFNFWQFEIETKPLKSFKSHNNKKRIT